MDKIEKERYREKERFREKEGQSGKRENKLKENRSVEKVKSRLDLEQKRELRYNFSRIGNKNEQCARRCV